MYEYLDRPPQVGDIVEFVDNSGYTFNKLGSLHQVTQIDCDRLSGLVPQLKEMPIPYSNRFKVVKTKPGNTAQAGDTIIRIADGSHPIGTIHPVYRNFGEGPSKDRVYYAYSCSITHTDVLVLCKATKQTGNPFKVGDRIRSISNGNPQERPIGKEFTVYKVTEDGVYYKPSLVAHYNNFELVSKAPDESTEPSIKIGSHWEDTRTEGRIIKVSNTLPDGTVKYKNNKDELHKDSFLLIFKPRPDLDTQQQTITTKDQSMDKTTLKLLLTLMGVKPEETKDATNSNYIGVITEGDNYIGYIYADTLSTIETIAAKPENEGRTIHTFKYTDSYTQAPRPIVKVTRASKTKA